LTVADRVEIVDAAGGNERQHSESESEPSPEPIPSTHPRLHVRLSVAPRKRTVETLAFFGFAAGFFEQKTDGEPGVFHAVPTPSNGFRVLRIVARSHDERLVELDGSLEAATWRVTAKRSSSSGDAKSLARRSPLSALGDGLRVVPERSSVGADRAVEAGLESPDALARRFRLV
jgi:hypothetical protein